MNRCDAEFPSGRYAPDIRLLRAGVAIDQGDWEYAVGVLTAILDNKGQADLGFHAAMNLADLFSKLHDDEARPGILQAIESRPAAKRRLAQFIKSETMGSRLTLMAPFLVETFGLEL